MGIFCLIFLSFLAQAAKVSYPEQKLSGRGVERIQILGVSGHVKLTGRASKFYRLKVRHTKNKASQDWSLSVDRQGNTLVLEVFSVAYGAQWRAHVRKELWPEFDIELEGPSKPATVSWREGEMEFIRWSSPLEVSQVKGRMSVREGSGEVALHLGQADLSVENFSGSLKIKGDRGMVRVNQLVGALDLDWLSGDVELKQIRADSKIEGRKGQLRVSSVTGKWDVNWAEGEAELENLSGTLKAKGTSTSWRISDSSLRDVEVQNGSGAVQWERNRGGARVFLTSNTGSIEASSRRSLLDGEGRRVSAFTVGRRPFAQVFVRTESGAIRFRK